MGLEGLESSLTLHIGRANIARVFHNAAAKRDWETFNGCILGFPYLGQSGWSCTLPVAIIRGTFIDFAHPPGSCRQHGHLFELLQYLYLDNAKEGFEALEVFPHVHTEKEDIHPQTMEAEITWASWAFMLLPEKPDKQRMGLLRLGAAFEKLLTEPCAQCFCAYCISRGQGHPGHPGHRHRPGGPLAPP